MRDIITCIEELRLKLERHSKEGLKEYPTRTIFIDPILEALGWNVRDPDEVQLEYSTIDGKSVDYAPKLNRRPVLFIESKPLKDPLTDVKFITQIVSYAVNQGVEWCILTNGLNYKVYRSTEKAEAPEKLLFEVSIDPKKSEGRSIQQIAEQLKRFSRDAMAQGKLDEIGEQVFTTAKIRKALDKIFIDPPNNLIKIIRSYVNDEKITPVQIKTALKRIWAPSPEVEINSSYSNDEVIGEIKIKQRGEDYSEEHHIKDKPREVIELFRVIDKFCKELDPAKVKRKYHAKYIGYTNDKNIFCCVHIQNSAIIIWLKLDYSNLENPTDFIRDVSNIGHWGVGNVEIRVDSIEKLQTSKPFIRQSFEKSNIL
jgi:hypothetical protein